LERVLKGGEREWERKRRSVESTSERRMSLERTHGKTRSMGDEVHVGVHVEEWRWGLGEVRFTALPPAFASSC
jgi:hypothetical protein